MYEVKKERNEEIRIKKESSTDDVHLCDKQQERKKERKKERK